MSSVQRKNVRELSVRAQKFGAQMPSEHWKKMMPSDATNTRHFSPPFVIT
jgi:hypothetical protein